MLNNVMIAIQLSSTSNLIIMVFGTDKNYYNWIQGSSSSISGLNNVTVSRSGRNVTFTCTTAFLLTVLT